MVGLGDTIDRPLHARGVHLEVIRQGLHGVVAGEVHTHQFGFGFLGHGACPPELLTSGPCGFKSCGATLADHCSFELCESAQHVKEHAACGRAGVD